MPVAWQKHPRSQPLHLCLVGEIGASPVETPASADPVEEAAQGPAPVASGKMPQELHRRKPGRTMLGSWVTSAEQIHARKETDLRMMRTTAPQTTFPAHCLEPSNKGSESAAVDSKVLPRLVGLGPRRRHSCDWRQVER
mmetsp:Transcript_59692/g.82879  ORF Transcript_59692/g.82879 Transcript_59692/m.82879 type:complete len:139 (+) Transcript_59692:249-665(+)